MGAFILMLLIVGVIVTIGVAKAGSSSGAESIWGAAAQRLGLRLERSGVSDGPTISGTRRGLSVHIDTFRKSGDDNRTYTRYRVNFKKSLGLGLRLTRQGPLAYVSRKLGTQDILTDDEDFDNAVVVKGRDPEEVIRFLNPSRRLRAVRFLTLYPGAVIDDTKIECETRNVARSPDQIVQTVQRMTTLAEQLTHGDEEGADYLEALTAEVEPDGDDHSIVLDHAPYHKEPFIEISDVLPPVLEVDSAPEAVETRGEVAEYPTDIASREPLAPTPTEQHSDEFKPEGTRFAEHESTGVRAVVQTLFAEGNTKSQTEEIFKARFKDQNVEWTGTLVNVRSFRFDLVFGDQPGTRAEFEMDQTDSATVGRTVKAVVRCPPEAEDEIRKMVDKRVTFRGRLFQCDAFMKTLFLTDGQICEVDA